MTTVGDGDLRQARRDLIRLRKDERATRQDIAKLERRIEAMETRPRVTDHAIVRYLERAYGIDMAALREEMLPADAVATVQKLGTCNISNGRAKLIVRKGVVVTAIEPD